MEFFGNFFIRFWYFFLGRYGVLFFYGGDRCFCGVFLGLNVKVTVMYGWDDFWVLNGL